VSRGGSSRAIYTKMDVLGLFLASGCFQMNGFSLYSPVGLHAEIEGVKGGGVNIDVHLGTTALDLWET